MKLEAMEQTVLTPKISVIIPCHNHGEFIREAIGSVLASAFEDYEIIIVNDGSTDPFTSAVFRELEHDFQDHRKVHILHQARSGLPEARNNGIRRSRGEYILPLDADNRVKPQFLSKASEILNNDPGVGVVYAFAELFGQREGIWEFSEFDPKRMLLYNLVEACSVYRRAVWEQHPYDSEMRIGYEDWDFWIAAMESGWAFHLIKEPLFVYQVREGSMVSVCNIPENRRALIRNICNKHRKSYMEHLAYVISEKDVDLLHANQRAERIFRETDAHICRLEAILREREDELNRICHSRVWQMFLRCHDIMDRTMPLASRRRRLAKMIFDAVSLYFHR